MITDEIVRRFIRTASATKKKKSIDLLIRLMLTHPESVVSWRSNYDAVSLLASRRSSSAQKAPCKDALCRTGDPWFTKEGWHSC